MQVAKEQQQALRFNEADETLKPWLTPELTQFGSVADLTAAGSRGRSEGVFQEPWLCWLGQVNDPSRARC